MTTRTGDSLWRMLAPVLAGLACCRCRRHQAAIGSRKHLRRAGLPRPARVLLLLCCLLPGCVAPMRVPTRNIGAVGMEQKGKIDLSFLQPGSTTRAEVLAQLGWLDAGARKDNLFLGRWTSSSWGLYGVIGGCYQGGCQGESINKRLWDPHNLMVEFDDEDVVTRYGVFSDKELVPELSAWVREGHLPPLDLSTPLEIFTLHRHSWDGYEHPTILSLTREFLELQEEADDPHHFSIPRLNLLRIEHAGAFSREATDPQYGYFTLHLRKKSPAGKKISLKLNLPSLLRLLRYLEDSRP